MTPFILKPMNKILSLISTSILLALSVVINLQAQAIKGRVTDMENNPLIGASVYIDGTTIGDVSDTKGNFSFEISSPINASMVCSYIGYKTAYIGEVSDMVFYLIKMEEDVSVLQEVRVTNNPFSREELMKFFEESIIGVGKVAQNCTLKNPETISFYYNTQTLVLKTYAEEPLILENQYLGYEITYELLNYEAIFNRFSLKTDYLRSCIFAGTSSFKELATKNKYEKRRGKAYENSTLSFFRAMAKDQLVENGYQLYVKRFPVKASGFLTVKEAKGGKEVLIHAQDKKYKPKEYQAEFSITYKGKEQSHVLFNTPSIYIDQFGLYSPFYQVLFSGAMSNKKLGLMLPADYKL